MKTDLSDLTESQWQKLLKILLILTKERENTACGI